MPGSAPTGTFFPDPNQRKLAEAAADGNTLAMSRSLAAGVNVNARGNYGMTYLIWAVLQRNKPSVQFLLENGADPNLQLAEGSELDEIGAGAGNSAMSLAAMLEDSWFLRAMLKHGGNPSLVNSTRSHTPIFSAMFSMRSENAKVLIQAGTNLNWQDCDGMTAFMQAAAINEYELAYVMLEEGADPTIKNRWGNTVVYFINLSVGRSLPEGTRWREKLVEKLQSKGIDVVNVH